MNFQSWLSLLVNWFGLPALALLGFVLVYRRWHRVFPLFAVYVIVAELLGIARLISSGAPSEVYAKIYWISEAVSAALALVATYEVFLKRLFPSYRRIRLYRILFPVAAILITVCAAVDALLGGHFSILAKTIHLYIFVRAAGLFFFVALMLIMGRRWNKQELGIAFGFGLDVSASLILLGTWAHSSSRSAIIAGWSVFAYDIACLVWLYSFWTAPKAQATVSPPELSLDALQEAKKWEGSLKDFMSQGKR
jgi:hypothetical protein